MIIVQQFPVRYPAHEEDYSIQFKQCPPVFCIFLQQEARPRQKVWSNFVRGGEMPKTNGVALADARRVIAAAEEKAAKINQPMNVAVVDAGGNLVAHVRMDGAWMGSIDISIKKAFTSRAFDISTQDLAKHAQPEEQFYGIH